MSLRDFLYNAAHASPGGVAALEVRMQKAPRTLQNALNPNMAETHRISEPDVERLLDFIPHGNLQAAEYFAGKSGAVVVQLPEMPDLGDMALLDEFLGLVKKIGDFSAEFQRDYADGKIDQKELRRIAKEAATVHVRLVGLMHHIEAIATPQPTSLRAIK